MSQVQLRFRTHNLCPVEKLLKIFMPDIINNKRISLLEGLSHEIVLPLMTICKCSNDFITQKVILAVNASLRWLNNVSGMYLVQVSLFLIGQQGLGQFFRYRPLLPIGWRIVQI
jgi:hypothetical protein